MPDGQLAFGQDVRPVAPSVTVQDSLVSRRLHHVRFPLLGSGRGCPAVRVPVAGALKERGAPREGRITLQPFDTARDLCRAVVVHKAFPTICQ